MEKLNLGCGNDYREGYTNLDISPMVLPDVIYDIEDYVPFRDNSFDEILANNVLTQILLPKKFIQVMNDMWRILKPGGVMYVRVPLATHPCAFQDPMDSRRFTEESFTYMQYDHRRYGQYGRHYGFKPFKVELLENNGRQMRFALKPVKDAQDEK